jgi:hypothetical protein
MSRDECEHGSLRRACALCDAREEIADTLAEIERLRARVESLRGSLKSAAGWLLDAGDLEHAEWCSRQAGDMEP